MTVITRMIRHGVTVQLCSLLLRPWFEHRPNRTYRRVMMIRAMAGQRVLFGVGQHLALIALCGGRPSGAQIVIVDADENGELREVETDEAPPIVRALMRFTMAAGRRDREQAWAVWLSMPTKDRVGVTMGLVSMAAEHLQSHMDPADRSTLPDLGPIPDDARDLTGGAS